MGVYTLIISTAEGSQHTTLSDFATDAQAVEDVGVFVSADHPSVAVARDVGDCAEFLGAWDFNDGVKAWTPDA